MTQMVAASITTSLDGYVTGPNDGPERGLGDGGERLHYWVFGARGATTRRRREGRRAPTRSSWTRRWGARVPSSAAGTRRGR